MKQGSAPNDVPRETQEAIDRYIALLARWNRAVNLVARGDLRSVRDRHIADSLQLVPHIPAHARRGIDLGSGAGFPGLILAAATGIPFDLIESDQRKAAFLREAARVMKAPVAVHAVRIETAYVPPAPLVTARALAPLPDLLRLAASFLEPGGVCLFPKGAGVQSELTAAANEWHMEVTRIASSTVPGAGILRISELHRVDPPAA